MAEQEQIDHQEQKRQQDNDVANAHEKNEQKTQTQAPSSKPIIALKRIIKNQHVWGYNGTLVACCSHIHPLGTYTLHIYICIYIYIYNISHTIFSV